MKNITDHCTKRMQQRGKSALDLRVIEKYGEYRRGGIRLLSRRRAKAIIRRMRKWLNKRENSALFVRRIAQIRQIISSVEKTTDWMMISADDDAVVTVYPADRKRQKKFMRGQCRPCCH